MASLSDYFPEEEKEKHLIRNLTIGSVIYFEDHNVNKSNNLKYHVVVGISNDEIMIATARINTNKGPVGVQYFLDSAKYKFLDHECYVDCSKVISHPKNDLKELLNSPLAKIKGEIPDRRMTIILDNLSKARTISPNDKKRFGLL